MRGKAYQHQANNDAGRGSPPPMRGKVIPASFVFLMLRITPAYAGKRGPFFPRDTPSGGSPPPMRGKGVSGFSLTSVFRITPAYAGKSVGLH